MGKSNLDKERQRAKAGKEAQEKNGTVALKNDTAEQAVGSGESGESGNAEPKQPAKLGAKKALRRALKAEMNKKSPEIAEALVKRTIEGDVRSTEMLMSLVVPKSNQDGKTKKKKRSGPSLAELLASEPEWVDPEPESTAEVCIGGQEPENTDS
jgi:hypothetical protein